MSPADHVREFVRLNRLAGKHRMFSYEGLEFADLTALLDERDALREALERIVRHTPADTLSFEQVREIGREALERNSNA